MALKSKNGNFLTFLKSFVTLFFPKVCKKCGNELQANNELLCKKCCDTLPKTNYENSKNNPVEQLFWGKVKVEHAFSFFYFRKGETLHKIVHLLKYKGNKKAGELLGTFAGKKMVKMVHRPHFDYLIPVPLHPKKFAKRGYNQCEILCDSISKITDIPVINNLLLRNIHNVSQTKKGKYERWQNVEGIFKLENSDTMQGKHLLLVDDIITTGSTIEACCATLLKIPNVKVSVMSIGYSSN